MLRATLKSLLGHKGRVVSTAIAVMLAVAFLSGTLIFNDTVQRVFDDLFSSVNANTDAAIRSATEIDAGFGSSTRGRIPDGLVARAERVPGVARAEGVVASFVQLATPDGEVVGSAGQGPPTFGFSWEGPSTLSPWKLAKGVAPTGPGQLALNVAAAETAGIAVGDTLTVATTAAPETFKVVGLVRFGSADSAAGSASALFDLATAQRLFGATKQVDEIDLQADPGITQDQLVSRVRSALSGADVDVISGTELTKESQNTVKQALGFFSTFLVTFAVIALFVSCFVISNTFSILIAQRTRELALLRALGARRGQVIRSVLAEAMVVGIAASAIGLGVGVLLSSGLKSMLGLVGFDLPAGGTVVTVQTLGIGFVVGVLATVVSALFPALRTSRITPIQALRSESIDRSATSQARIVIGLLVAGFGITALVLGLLAPKIGLVGLGAALVFIGVFILGPVIAGPVSSVLGAPLARYRGIVGRLARQNAVRNPKRTARTAAALTIGVALVSGVTVLASSLRQSIEDTVAEQFTGDIAVSSSGFGPQSGFSPALNTQISQLPEVKVSTGIRVALIEIDGEGQFVSSVDPQPAFALFDLGWKEGKPADLTADAIFVLESRAKDLGLKVGEKVTARFLNGATRTLTVKGIYTEAAMAGNYVVSQKLTEATGGEQRDFAVYAQLADGVGVSEGRAAIARLAKQYVGVKVQDRAEYTEAQTASITPLVNLIYGLLGLAVIIAAFGIANTLRLSVQERTQEIGLMRSVGMSRRQVRSTIRWEAVLTAVLGAIQGIVIGLFLGYAVIYSLRDQGLNRFSVPSASLIVIVAIAAAIGVIAAIRPARRAARMDILHAIGTE